MYDSMVHVTLNDL